MSDEDRGCCIVGWRSRERAQVGERRGATQEQWIRRVHCRMQDADEAQGGKATPEGLEATWRS